MFKLTGSAMILLSSVFVFSRKVLESYFTYKFLSYAETVTEKLIYESGSNLSYYKIFKKIGFDKEYFLLKSEKNRYIRRCEYITVENFIDNLGKRDSNSEKIYIRFNLDNIKNKKETYYKTYCDTRKIYTLCGGAIGLFIIIFLI